MARLQDGVTRLKKWLVLVTLLEEGGSESLLQEKDMKRTYFQKGFFFSHFCCWWWWFYCFTKTTQTTLSYVNYILKKLIETHPVTRE